MYCVYHRFVPPSRGYISSVSLPCVSFSKTLYLFLHYVYLLILLYIYFYVLSRTFFRMFFHPIFILYHKIEICQLLFYCLSDSKKKGGYLNSPGNFDMKFTYSFLILILFMEVNFSISINSSTSNGASSSFSKLKFSFFRSGK